jgi:hypothetical protein
MVSGVKRAALVGLPQNQFLIGLHVVINGSSQAENYGGQIGGHLVVHSMHFSAL